jgi:hypothetical protein
MGLGPAWLFAVMVAVGVGSGGDSITGQRVVEMAIVSVMIVMWGLAVPEGWQAEEWEAGQEVMLLMVVV